MSAPTDGSQLEMDDIVVTPKTEEGEVPAASATCDDTSTSAEATPLSAATEDSKCDAQNVIEDAAPTTNGVTAPDTPTPSTEAEAVAESDTTVTGTTDTAADPTQAAAATPADAAVESTPAAPAVDAQTSSNDVADSGGKLASVPVHVVLHNPQQPDTPVLKVALRMPLPPGTSAAKKAGVVRTHTMEYERANIAVISCQNDDEEDEDQTVRKIQHVDKREIESALSSAQQTVTIPAGADPDDDTGKAAGTGDNAGAGAAENVKVIDKSTWTRKAMLKHPELLELKERVSPLHRACAFGRIFNAGRTEVKETLNDEHILQLIMQHLWAMGLKETVKHIEGESNIQYPYYDWSESRLLSIMRRAIRDVDRVYDLTMVEPGDGDKDTEEELLDYLDSLGLQPQEVDVDTDIWTEPPDSEDNISVANNAVKGGTLHKLVERLTRENPQGVTTYNFLMTYRSFTTPQKLLQKLMQRYSIPESKRQSMKEDEVMRIQLKVCNVLKTWVANYHFDFNEKMLDSLKHFIDNTVANNRKLQTFPDAFRALLSRIEANKNKFGGQVSLTDCPPPKVPRNIFSSDLDIFDIDEEELARQITLNEFRIYASIRPSELLNQSWNKAKTRHRSPNVLALINRFNDFSLWVTSQIVNPPKIKQRTRNVTKLMLVAKHLRNMNNFNSLMAIISGLNNAASHRLKHTREEVPRRIFEEHETVVVKIMATDGAFKAYRNALSALNPPCLPYLGTFLTDLTFIEDGNKDHLPGTTLINFGKRQLVYNVIEEIQRFQNTPYSFAEVHQIQQKLNFPSMDNKERDSRQKALYATSLQREPRGADRSTIA
eukprot:GFYU01015047.1.p1 GENE.GFYU01015047.1~~GFYU01015047.1.p1  ORF type:complete len:854 (-),score=178.57 GFYU01015047.1:98-2584(-)